MEAMRIFYAGTQQGRQERNKSELRRRDAEINDPMLCQIRLLYLEDTEITAEAIGRRFGCSERVAQRYLYMLEEEPFPWED